MKIEMGKFYKCRNGLKAYPIKMDLKSSIEKHVIMIVISPQGWEDCYTYTKDGRRHNDSYGPHDFDIISEWREPVRVEGWLNYYGPGDEPYFYESKIEADHQARRSRIACIWVSGEEGKVPDEV